MISQTLIQRALEKERKYWLKRINSEYMKGIVQGLVIASQVIGELPKVPWYMRKKRMPEKGNIL